VAPQDVCKLRLELRKGWVVQALQGERGLDEPQGREVEFRAVVQELGAIDEPGESGRGGKARASLCPAQLSLMLGLCQFRRAQRVERL
jgi:hypothetical protein